MKKVLLLLCFLTCTNFLMNATASEKKGRGTLADRMQDQVGIGTESRQLTDRDKIRDMLPALNDKELKELRERAEKMLKKRNAP